MRRFLLIATGITVVAFLLPLIVIGVIIWLVYAISLLMMIWLFWTGPRKHVLLVSSDSPTWSEYVESQIRPQLPPAVRFLNWSERSNWSRWSLKVRAFWLVAGDREFNPIVIVFRPFHLPRIFRFWKAFRDYKHGNKAALERLEREMFDYLDRSGIARQ